jgi:AraC family transcriptional regulator, regulatory protein of adaptative response / methylated-DNA-[protein]-cysteine methyltransferase
MTALPSEFDVDFSVERGTPGPHIPPMTMTRALPEKSVMLEAFFGRDPAFDGVFVTGVRTTGIFCRTTCSARKPLPKNISFFHSARDALLAGYRPCRRCRPLEMEGTPPAWLRPLLDELEGDPGRRWTDHDIRGRGLSPERVRRWFKKHHDMTFQAYSRARRLGAALGQVHDGDSVSRAAFQSGYDSLSGFQEAFRRYFGDAPTRLDGATVVDVTRIMTPLGPMLAGCTPEALCLLEFVERRMLPNQIKRIGSRLDAVFVPGANAITREVERQVSAYFAGDLQCFELPLELCGTTFQTEVWHALQRIPFGRRCSYADIAKQVGRPSAVRAVGTANGVNALAIIVPCHRVVGADGRLVGYGGGLWRKQRLLDLEAETASADPGR